VWYICSRPLSRAGSQAGQQHLNGNTAHLCGGVCHHLGGQVVRALCLAEHLLHVVGGDAKPPAAKHRKKPGVRGSAARGRRGCQTTCGRASHQNDQTDGGTSAVHGRRGCQTTCMGARRHKPLQGGTSAARFLNRCPTTCGKAEHLSSHALGANQHACKPAATSPQTTHNLQPQLPAGKTLTGGC